MTNQKNKYIHLKLIEYIFNKKKFDTKFVIAKSLLDRIDDFPDVTIEEIAYQANTTPSTISKFCKQLGYDGFTSFKNDTRRYEPSNLFDQFQHLFSEQGLEQSINYFSRQNDLLFRELFQSFDDKQMERISKRVLASKKVSIFSGVHSMIAANLCSELLLPFGIFVYEVERDSDTAMLQSLIKESDSIFIVSLTNEWTLKNLESLDISNEELKKFILITYQDSTVPFIPEVVSLVNIPDIFTSTYNSISGLFSFFILLSAYLEKTNSQHNSFKSSTDNQIHP